jgi:hypothetical protein
MIRDLGFGDRLRRHQIGKGVLSRGNASGAAV